MLIQDNPELSPCGKIFRTVPYTLYKTYKRSLITMKHKAGRD